MTGLSTTEASNGSEPRATLGPDCVIAALGFDEDVKKPFEELVYLAASKISEVLDLSSLAGITISYDYLSALASIERGVQDARPLTPTRGHAVGVAMTTSVYQGGHKKSHIVFNAPYLVGLGADLSHPAFGLALNTFAHECAHVHANASFDKVFPDIITPSRRSSLRWDCIMGCWDEFAATYFSAGYGADPTDSFEELFLQALSNAPSLVQTALAAFRTTRNAPRLLNEAASAYGLLLKYSAYHLGNLRGQERTVDERPRTLSALAANPWFNRYFDRLSSTCNKLLANFGRWPDTGDFESIADLLEELMSNAGLQMQDGEGGGLRLYVNEQRPWTPSQARPRTAP